MHNPIYSVSAELTPVRVAQATSLGPRVLPILLAGAEGFFEAEGLKLEFILMPQAGPAALVAALANGEIDYELDNGGFLPAIEKGMPIIFRQAIGRWPAHVIARPGINLQDAEGKIILTHLATTHGQIRGLKTILSKHGIKAMQVQSIYDPMIIIDMLKNPKQRGVYDYGFLTNRLIDAQDMGLVTLLDYFMLRDARIANYLIERTAINPDTSKKFHRAFARAVSFINEPANKTRVIDYTVRFKIEKDRETAEKLYRGYLMKMLVPGGLPVSDGEFIEFAKFFEITIPREKIRTFYNPSAPK